MKKHTTIFIYGKVKIILLVNSIIFLIAAFSLGIEKAMYSILTYFTATKTTDYVVDGFEEYTALSIISKEYDLVKEIIVKDFNKAITVYKGERGYLPKSFDIKTDCDIMIFKNIYLVGINDDTKETLSLALRHGIKVHGVINDFTVNSDFEGVPIVSSLEINLEYVVVNCSSSS